MKFRFAWCFLNVKTSPPKQIGVFFFNWVVKQGRHETPRSSFWKQTNHGVNNWFGVVATVHWFVDTYVACTDWPQQSWPIQKWWTRLRNINNLSTYSKHFWKNPGIQALGSYALKFTNQKFFIEHNINYLVFFFRYPLEQNKIVNLDRAILRKWSRKFH